MNCPKRWLQKAPPREASDLAVARMIIKRMAKPHNVDTEPVSRWRRPPGGIMRSTRRERAWRKLPKSVLSRHSAQARLKTPRSLSTKSAPIFS